MAILNLFGKKDGKVSRLNVAFEEKVGVLFSTVTNDSRWDIDNEGLFIAFGMELYGYSFGVGQSFFFVNEEDINNYIIKLLIGIGGGEKYVQGLVEYAHSTFHKEDNGLYSQLVNIGWQHFSDNNLEDIVNSIFANAEVVKQAST